MTMDVKLDEMHRSFMKMDDKLEKMARGSSNDNEGSEEKDEIVEKDIPKDADSALE